jgi:hypothetical protein
MMRRTDGQPLRDQLFLFLPPGPGDTNYTLLRWAAYAGYPVVSLGWTNEAWLQDCAPDDACFDRIRGILAYGDPAERILPHDSIVGRLESFFAFQLLENPDWGWEQWYDPALGEVRWDDIVLVGWSSGGGQAAYIAKDHAVEGVISISSPGDTMFDGVGPAPASWLSQPSATPECDQYGFYHQEEVNSDVVDMFLEGYLAMGLAGPSVDTTVVPPPYGDAQILTTTLTDWTQSWCTFHQAMAMDQCMDDALVEPYLYLFCRVADDTCP